MTIQGVFFLSIIRIVGQSIDTHLLCVCLTLRRKVSDRFKRLLNREGMEEHLILFFLRCTELSACIL